MLLLITYWSTYDFDANIHNNNCLFYGTVLLRYNNSKNVCLTNDINNDSDDDDNNINNNTTYDTGLPHAQGYYDDDRSTDEGMHRIKPGQFLSSSLFLITITNLFIFYYG